MRHLRRSYSALVIAAARTVQVTTPSYTMNYQPSTLRTSGTGMIKFLVLGFVLAGAMICSGCFSLSSTTTRTAPAPASAPPPPPPGMQRTVYPDGTYVDQPIQPVSR